MAEIWGVCISHIKVSQNLEQRFTIKICVKLGKSTSEICTVLSEAHGTEAVKKSSAFWVVYTFKEVPREWSHWRSSHPKMNSSNENSEKVWNLVIQTIQDRKQACYVEILKLCETVHRIRPELWPKNLFLHHAKLQLIKHSLSKEFMAKYLLMDSKPSLFTKFGPHWLLALYKIEVHLAWTNISGHWSHYKKCDCNNEGYSKRWVPYMFLTVAGSLGKVCSCSRGLLWR